jgi:hypothetical protein
MRVAKSLSIIAVLLTQLGVAEAGKKAGVTMPDTITVADKQLSLNGMGLREATFLKIDVYVAGLYVQTVSSDPGKLIASNEVKRLVLKFVRNVDRKDIVKAWNEGFANNPVGKPSAIQGQIAVLNGWMGDFADGDTLTFTFIPGEGVSVDVRNSRKGVVKGDEFARALLAIWLGPKPPTKALKTGLLGTH